MLVTSCQQLAQTAGDGGQHHVVDLGVVSVGGLELHERICAPYALTRARPERGPTNASAAHSSANGWRMIVLHFSGGLRRGSLR